MAETVVSSVVSQLANLLVQEAILLGGVHDQIQQVKTELQMLQGFLKDADSRRKRGDARMESWISGIRGVAYEIEDVIDTIKYMGERQHQRKGCMRSSSRYSHKLGEWFNLHKISSRIKQIEIKIQNISQYKDRLGIANLGEGSMMDDSNLQPLRQFSPHFDDDVDLIGFEDDKKHLIKQLLDPSVTRLCVISVVGMGGLGKTTLTRKVYNDPIIKEHFDAIAWISVSQEYEVIKLLKTTMEKAMGIKKKDSGKKKKKKFGIVEELDKEEITTGITIEELAQMNEDEVKEKLHDYLKEKRYLIVVDDVWTINVWRQMQQVFPNENNGSRIMLTTRKIEVAKSAEPWIPPHELHLLNDTESWQLFCRKAFPPKQDVSTELEALAQKLAKRCGGLPLALVVLGGLLSRKDLSYDTWQRVARSMNWESSGDGQECLDILGLSYKDLPCQLKSCFLYIAAFPEDYTISASKLVRLWIAEGFIPQEQTQTMEDTARDWLDELVQRCMIQVVERSRAYGRVKRIRIHDMLRDFGLSEARKDGFLHVCNSDVELMAMSGGIPSHRIAFHNCINDEVIVSSPHLRTLLSFNSVCKNIKGRFLSGLNLLRVLDLEGAKDVQKLPKQVGKMIHLRYLGLRGTGLKKLPSSIGHLLNLQTLDVRDTYILWPPKSFWKIRTLRHVYIGDAAFLTVMGDQKNLQTLRITNSEVDMDFMGLIRAFYFLAILFIKNWDIRPGFTDEALDRVNERELGKSLAKALEKAQNLVSLSLDDSPIPMEVFFAWAPNLRHLHSLHLRGMLSPRKIQLTDSNQFPPNLTKLILTDSKLEQDPMPLIEKLLNLRLLALERNAYVGKSISCSSTSGFPRLLYLILAGLPDFEEWAIVAGAMPSLSHLTINTCRMLKMLPEGLQHVTTLKELKLIDMPQEFDDRVKDDGDDRYKVLHIPSMIFEKRQVRYNMIITTS